MTQPRADKTPERPGESVLKLLSSCVCTFLITTPALAEKGDWLVRTRALLVAPTERSGPVLPAFPNSAVSIDNAMTGEVDFTYFITRNIAYEGIVGYPAHHAISGEGDLAFIGEIVGTDALASMGTLQVHPFPACTQYRPRQSSDPGSLL